MMKNTVEFFWSALIISSLLWINCSMAQNFCQSYQSHPKVIVYYDQSFSGALLIVGPNYWQLRHNNTDLFFQSEDRLPIDSSHLLGNNYSYAFKAEVDITGTNESDHDYEHVVGQAFFNTENRTFDILAYNQTTKMFGLLLSGLPVNDSVGLSDTSFGFNIFHSSALIGLVEQTLDYNRYKRQFKYYSAFSHDGLELILTSLPEVSPEWYKLEQITGDYEMVGIFMTNASNIFIMFRLGSTIKYCTTNQCSKSQIKTLIDCSKDKKTFVKFILIMVGLLGLLLFLVILLVIFYLKVLQTTNKNQTQKTRSESRHQSQDSKESLNSSHLSIKTLAS